MEEYLQSVYCEQAGYEYTHLLDKTESEFFKRLIEENIESLKVKEFTKEDSSKAFDRLCKDQSFIDFLSNKFANFKRFGIEGLNTATIALEELSETAAKTGTKKLVLGMAHRGRLNTLHCVFNKPAQQIFE
jgi:2-oxoglutarate dehydrogenase E1 component